jgi:hypothetical protein
MTRSELIAIWPPTATAARKAGHEPMSPLKAIREKCRDCSCYQLSEIRLCAAINCALWPFRAGRHPWMVEAEKTAARTGFLSSKRHYSMKGSCHDIVLAPFGCSHGSRVETS